MDSVAVGGEDVGGDALESTKDGATHAYALEESSRCFRLPELWEVIS